MLSEDKKHTSRQVNTKSSTSGAAVDKTQNYFGNPIQTDAGPVQFINGQYVLVNFDETLKVYKPVVCADPKVLRAELKLVRNSRILESFGAEPITIHYLSGVRPESKNCVV